MCRKGKAFEKRFQKIRGGRMMNLEKRRYVFFSILAIICLTGCCPRNHANQSPGHERIQIDLRLLKSECAPTESLDAEVTITNISNKDMRIPVCQKDYSTLFFDFVILSNAGHLLLLAHSEGWGDPSWKPVKLIRLLPGEAYHLKLKDAIPLNDVSLTGYMDMNCSIIAIYRDHSYGYAHSKAEIKKGPPVWKGVAVSAPARIVVRSEKPQKAPPKLNP
jgi:hypothetical protein